MAQNCNDLGDAFIGDVLGGAFVGVVSASLAFVGDVLGDSFVGDVSVSLAFRGGDLSYTLYSPDRFKSPGSSGVDDLVEEIVVFDARLLYRTASGGVKPCPFAFGSFPELLNLFSETRDFLLKECVAEETSVLLRRFPGEPVGDKRRKLVLIGLCVTARSTVL